MRHEAPEHQRLVPVPLEEGVRLFESAGSAPDEIVEPIHRGGGVLLHKCPSVRHAVTAQRLGVDAVGLVGMEEGGHPGANQLPSFVNAAFALEGFQRLAFAQHLVRHLIGNAVMVDGDE